MSAGGGDQHERSSAKRSPMVSRSWSGLTYLACVVLRRHAFDRQLQVFAIGIIDLGNARPVIEHAAERRRAGLVGSARCTAHGKTAWHRSGAGAGRRRRRRPTAGGGETDDEAPEHDELTRNARKKMVLARGRIKLVRSIPRVRSRRRNIPVSSPGLTGRSSIPETVAIELRSRGVLGPPSSRRTTCRGATATALTPSSSRP